MVRKGEDVPAGITSDALTKQYDVVMASNVLNVQVTKKTGFLIPGQGDEVAVSPSRYSVSVMRGGGVDLREARDVKAVEFYGGDKSLFKK